MAAFLFKEVTLQPKFSLDCFRFGYKNYVCHKKNHNGSRFMRDRAKVFHRMLWKYQDDLDKYVKMTKPSRWNAEKLWNGTKYKSVFLLSSYYDMSYKAKWIGYNWIALTFWQLTIALVNI